MQAENLNSVTLSKAQIEVIHSKINLLLDNPNVSPEELVDAMDDSNEPKEKGTKAHKIMGSAMYGFFDGLFHGALSDGINFVKNGGIGKVGKGIKELPGKLDLRKAFTDKKCEIGSHKIKKSLKRIGRHAGYFAGNLTKIIKTRSLKLLHSSGKDLSHALKHFLRHAVSFIFNCPGTKMLAVVAGLIMVGVALVGLVNAGTGGLMIIWQVLNLIFAGTYIRNRLRHMRKLKKKIKSGTCEGSKCKLGMVEARFSIVGAITEVLLLSCKGLILRAGKLLSKVAKSLKIKFAPSIAKDFGVLFKFMKKAKKGKPVDVAAMNTNLQSTPWLFNGDIRTARQVMETAGKVSKNSDIGKIANTYSPVVKKVENVVDAMQKGHARHQKAMDALKAGHAKHQQAMNALKSKLGMAKKVKKSEDIIDNAADVGKLGKLADTTSAVAQNRKNFLNGVTKVSGQAEKALGTVGNAATKVRNHVEKGGRIGKAVGNQVKKVEKAAGEYKDLAKTVGTYTKMSGDVYDKVDKAAKVAKKVDNAIVTTGKVAKKTEKIATPLIMGSHVIAAGTNSNEED